MQLVTLIMRLSYNNFKIRKLVEGNCKILCTCIFFFCQYMKFFFYQIIHNLSFILTTMAANKFVISLYLGPNLFICMSRSYRLGLELRLACLPPTLNTMQFPGFPTFPIGSLCFPVFPLLSLSLPLIFPTLNMFTFSSFYSLSLVGELSLLPHLTHFLTSI